MVKTTDSLLVLVAIVLLSARTFGFVWSPRCFSVQTTGHFRSRMSFGRNPLWVQAKKGSFSDDIFGDDDESPMKTRGAVPAQQSNEGTAAVNRVPIDDDLFPELSQELADGNFLSEFESVFGSEDDDGGEEEDDISEDDMVPVYISVFFLRDKFIKADIRDTLKLHDQMLKSRSRYLETEIVNLGAARAIVMFWAGIDKNDNGNTQHEIAKYLSESPFVVKDMIKRRMIFPLHDKAKFPSTDLELLDFTEDLRLRGITLDQAVLRRTAKELEEEDKELTEEEIDADLKRFTEVLDRISSDAEAEETRRNLMTQYDDAAVPEGAAKFMDDYTVDPDDPLAIEWFKN